MVNKQDNEDTASVQRLVKLTLTEDEYWTMTTALNLYEHYYLDKANRLAQGKIPFTGDPLERVARALEFRNRACDLIGRLRKEWEAIDVKSFGKE